MASIDTIGLAPAWRTVDLWPQVAGLCRNWLQGQGLHARDAVLLVPYAALLAPARAALAEAGGWQARVETPLTLAATLGPPPAPELGSCQGEAIHDMLAAGVLLRRQSWGAAWAQRDPAGLAAVTALVVEAAQALREAALSCPPAEREAFWRQARTLTALVAGPAATEALLLQVALEWASTAGPALTDRLFNFRPAAWMALQIGGTDAFTESLLRNAGLPALRLRADAEPGAPWHGVAAGAALERVLCEDFEAEAQAAASEVIQALNGGRAPVALVALDREVVRRVRALLERSGVAMVDETGWLLATTRAASRVVALLRAALPGAGPDARLDWLKTWPAASKRALDGLEALWRGRRHVVQRAAAESLWEEAQAHLQPLAVAGVQPLVAWLDTLQGLLAREGSFDALGADPAGAQVLAALGYAAPPAWRHAAATVRMDLSGFVQWVEQTLEATPYLPPPDAGAQVVLTPLSRACGRSFGHIVVPGADDQHLGRPARPASLIGATLGTALGLADEAGLRERQRLRLAHVLRAPRVTLLRRRRDGDEPLADSPDVEWLLLARARSGAAPWPLRDWAPATAAAAVQASVRPEPRAAGALPEVLSASQLGALRECPYRFFARAVLRLDEPEELEAELEKRDYGNWLHAVLYRFHSERSPSLPLAAQLQAAADAVTLEQGLAAAELLPFRASFERLAPRYLAWLAQREAQGWCWHSGESDHRISPPELQGLALRGRIDRLDAGPLGTRQLLDYKTGSAKGLAAKTRSPLEDTQLAFYAALLGAGPELSAAYLALDDAEAPIEIPHPKVHDTAAALLQGLGGEWQRLRAGAAMTALGEGRVCETCEARGLCRRDQWPAGA